MAATEGLQDLDYQQIVSGHGLIRPPVTESVEAVVKCSEGGIILVSVRLVRSLALLRCAPEQWRSGGRRRAKLIALILLRYPGRAQVPDR